MANINRVQDGGFEQSSPPNFSSHWTPAGGAVAETFQQLLGNFTAHLPSGGGSISQTLLPLTLGERYTFEAALSANGFSGTIDVSISGSGIQEYQSFAIVKDFVFATYSFDFTANTATPLLTIKNNTDGTVHVDVVSVKLA